METVLVLLLRKMFDSQDFMGFTPDEALRAWELLPFCMCERARVFFFLGGKVTFVLPNMLICAQKNLCKDQVFANTHTM